MYLDSVHYLQDSAVTIRGVKFYGAPWTPDFYNWGFMTFNSQQRKEIWSKIPTDTNVLITHGPPTLLFRCQF